MCTLQFSVDGEFITDLSREWFYVEGKGYDKCMDLLESSMSGTDETITLKNGRKKIYTKNVEIADINILRLNVNYV